MKQKASTKVVTLFIGTLWFAAAVPPTIGSKRGLPLQ
jgi:hypothetical protein